MMKDKTQMMAVCSITGNGYVPATVGIDAFCTECNISVWLSDTTVSAIKEHAANNNMELDEKQPIKVVCIPCGLEAMKKEKEIKIQPPTNDQIKEIKNAIGK